MPDVATVDTDSGSLSDHEQRYYSREARQVPQEAPEAVAPVPEEPAEPVTTGPDINAEARQKAAEEAELARDPDGRFREREKHRAKSQKATAADAPRISELTKKWRTTESERDAIKVERDRLAAELEQARRGRDSIQPETKADVVPTGTFDKPKPTIQALIDAGAADPYADLPDAIADWRDEKRAFEQAQKDRTESVQRTAQQKEASILAAHAQRSVEFEKSHPDYQSVLAAYPHNNISPVMQYAMITSDKSAELMYSLAKQPVFLDELFLLTEGRTIEQAEKSGLVASLQRRMLARVQTASTGTVAPPVKKPSAPRPPIPVRTGPLTTGDEPPDDGASLSAHEQYYYRGKGQPRRS